ncbi:hypothetical protein [Shewanella holmiensis]|uniref:Lipoprotein n=1 Tax=Shewanella holmiensis TaxID=2952222 RepID=A0A9X3AVR6_9GAMM|nr:hypothetical protein [Shewanella holmiensis]MCT7942574.1 hypothetical protein [Shewanella holmiensis]
MLRKSVFGCLVLLSLSACSASTSDSYEDEDINVEVQVPAEAVDPMMENNERLIRESQEDVWQKRIK